MKVMRNDRRSTTKLATGDLRVLRLRNPYPTKDEIKNILNGVYVETQLPFIEV